MFNSLKQTSVLENTCVYSSVPAEAVTVAILSNMPHFIVRVALGTKKLNRLKCSCRNDRMFCGIISYNKCSKRCVSALTQAQNRFLPLVYCPVDDTLFEVSQDLRYFMCIESTLLLRKPHSYSSKPI